MKKRVVITGYGVVSPFGIGKNALKEGLDNRKSTVRIMTEWPDIKGLKSRLGAPAPLENEKDIPRKARRSMSKMSVLSVQAAQEALTMSHLSQMLLQDGHTGCIMGSTTGSPQAIQEAFEKIIFNKDISELTSMSFFKGMSHTVASNVAMYFGISGPVLAPSAACASSLQAIALGTELIRSGKQKVLLCGGAEELHPATTASFDILEATSINFFKNPHLTPRPFDKDRDGLVCGEGAGVVILEELEHALLRQAPIYCEVTGYETNTSTVPMSQSDPVMLSRCMQKAIEDSGLKLCEIDYVSAHGTGTLHGDQAEAEAINIVFGPASPFVSSLKGYMGHTLAASGAIETAACMIMMENNLIYPGLNLDNIAPECSIINLLREKKQTPLNAILKNSFAFGGINVSVVYRRYKE